MISVGSSSTNSRFRVGQDSTHYGGFVWNYNATPANANLQIHTDGTAAVTIDQSQVVTVANAINLSGGINYRIDSITSSSTPTPIVATDDYFIVTAQAAAATITNPTGVIRWGKWIIILIKDNGTARPLTFDTKYRFSANLPAPTTTTQGKWMRIGIQANQTAGYWDVTAIQDGF